MMCKFRNGVVRWQISKSIKLVPLHFYAHRFRYIKFVDLKKYIKVTSTVFRNDTVRWEMSKSAKDSNRFLRLLLPFQIY